MKSQPPARLLQRRHVLGCGALGGLEWLGDKGMGWDDGWFRWFGGWWYILNYGYHGIYI
jgi:hypothetical protein